MYRIVFTLIGFLGVAGCGGSPLAGLTTLDEVAVAEDAPAVAVVASDAVEVSTDDAIEAALKAVEDDEAPTFSGFFSGIFSGGADEAADPAAVSDGSEPVDATAAEIVTAAENAESTVIDPETMAEPVQAGFFSRIFGGGGNDADEIDAQSSEQIPTPVSDVPASGLSAILGRPAEPAAPTGPDAQRVAMDTLLPFGQIATNCEVQRRQLGTKVGEDAGYTLYDTIPNATALRTHYVTGFKDRCARQFTAATAIMGDVGTHEVVRYLPENRNKSFSVTDNAYEQVKASFCRVSRGRPCGSRLDRLARRTVFITAYKRFSSSPDWANILLHEGRVVAIGPK